MKIIIDEMGYLKIERNGNYRTVLCPICRNEGGESGCGDWCSLFGEPENYGDGDIMTSLKLCHKKYIVLKSEFQDIRCWKGNK